MIVETTSKTKANSFHIQKKVHNDVTNMAIITKVKIQNLTPRGKNFNVKHAERILLVNIN